MSRTGGQLARTRSAGRLAARTRTGGYVAGWSLVRMLPELVSREAFDLVGRAAYRRNARPVERLRANLRRVVGAASGPELEALTRAGMRSYLRYWHEVFRLPAMSRDRILGRMFVHDEYLLRDAWSAGRGMILALPHMGNWDHAGAWLVHTGVPFTTVAERLRPEALYDRFVAFRESLGMEVLPLTGSRRPPFHLLRDRLAAGGCLCLLADRDLTTSGVEVDFFGEPARMPAGPAALALDTGAALLPVTLWYPDRYRWEARIHPRIVPPADGGRQERVRAMTQQLADAFASDIRRWPQDWHMFQKVWVADLDRSRLADALAAVP